MTPEVREMGIPTLVLAAVALLLTPLNALSAFLYGWGVAGDTGIPLSTVDKARIDTCCIVTSLAAITALVVIVRVGVFRHRPLAHASLALIGQTVALLCVLI